MTTTTRSTRTRPLPTGEFLRWETGDMWRRVYEADGRIIGRMFRNDSPGVGRAKGWYAGHSSGDFVGSDLPEAVANLRARRTARTD
jgi:hypothetical protein